MKYIKEIKKFIGSSVKYDEWAGGYIWGVLEKDFLQMIAQVVDVDDQSEDYKSGEVPVVSVRGWGAIQHLFKTSDEQKEFQNELGIFIQDAINEKLKTL